MHPEQKLANDLTPMVARQLARLGERRWGKGLRGLKYSVYYEADPPQWYVRSNRQKARFGEGGEPCCDCYKVMLLWGVDSTFSLVGDERQGYIHTQGLSERELQAKVDSLYTHRPYRELASIFADQRHIRQITINWQQQIEEGLDTPDQVPQSSWTTICPECGTVLQSAKRFCTNCGTTLADPAVLSQVYDLLLSGRKVRAIKLYHQTYPIGLRKAKETVEKLEQSIKER